MTLNGESQGHPPLKTARAPTIKDVAREAGVSIASVSRVLNGKDTVTGPTKERVREVVERLQYVPHTGARNLITRKTQTIGIVLPDLHGAFFSELIRGIDQAARKRKWHILLATAHDDADEAVGAIRSLLGRVDGLLILSPHLDTDLIDQHLPVSTPVVLMNSKSNNVGRPVVRIDNFQGAAAMTRHLLQCGHSRIAHVDGPEDNMESQERLAGYLYAIEQAGQTPDIFEGDFSEEAGRRAVEQMLARSSLPDAIFAANDMTAVGCLGALRDAGLSVPGDIALAGFDDIPLARHLAPPLTTMSSHIDKLGMMAVSDLLQLIEHEGSPPQRLLTPELVIRSSCGTGR